jgi:hypothetical protein
MGNQSGSNSKQRSMPQPQGMAGSVQGAGQEWQPRNSPKGQGGGKQRNMPNPQRMGGMGGAPDDNMGITDMMQREAPSGAGMSPPTADGSYTADQRKMLEDAGMGRANWDDNSYQTDGGPSGAQLMARMKQISDPAMQHQFYNKYAGKGRGGNDLSARLLVDKGGQTGMNDWINTTATYGGLANTGYNGPPGGMSAGNENWRAGTGPTTGYNQADLDIFNNPMGGGAATTDPLSPAPGATPAPGTPMPKAPGRRYRPGRGGSPQDIQGMLARLMGGG